MRKNFNPAMEILFRHEGGYSNHPKDPGGPTKYGITMKNLQRWEKRKVSIRDVKNVTKEKARRIYKSWYWDKVKADQMPSGVDYVVFDFGVNAGPSRSAKTLQKTLGVSVDGIIGPQTLGAIRKKPSSFIINDFSKRRLSFYRGLRTFKYFGRGWTRRTKEARKFALKLSKQKDNFNRQLSASQTRIMTKKYDGKKIYYTQTLRG